MSDTNKTVYDPAKNYKWDMEATFPLNGQEYGFIYNTLIKKRVEIMRELDILNVLEGKLRDAVERGVATEIVPEMPVKTTE